MNLSALRSRAIRCRGLTRFLPSLMFAIAAAAAGALSAQPAAADLPLTSATNVVANDADELPPAAPVPAGVKVLRDQCYGNDRRECFDVYLPDQPLHEAPVIFMVHGGAWAFGDKAARAVVEHKVARWVPRGFVVVSTNYKMLPRTLALEQARGVARALAEAQKRAPQWGASPQRFVLMGHSSGAHLVALLASSPAVSAGLGVMPWLGSVALDSAAYDVVQIMRAPRYPRFYDRAFGNELAYWRRASPLLALQAPGAPLLAVCSARRSDSCPQAQAYVAKAVPLGMRASLLVRDLSHGDINRELGADPAYTEAVETFLASLDPSITRLLGASLAAKPGEVVPR